MSYCAKRVFSCNITAIQKTCFNHNPNQNLNFSYTLLAKPFSHNTASVSQSHRSIISETSPSPSWKPEENSTLDTNDGSPNKTLQKSSEIFQSLKSKISTIPLLSESECLEFITEFPNVVQDLENLEGLENMSESKAWATRVVNYNVPNGKLFRPALLISMAKLTQEKTGVDLPNLNRIAWTSEFFHAAGLILDDIADGSVTRRGRKCWYLVDNLGSAAINDGLLLENAQFLLYKKYMKGKYPLYHEFMDYLHGINYKTIHGQCLDLCIATGKQYDRLNIDTFRKVATHKAGYYTFVAPMDTALILNGIMNPQINRKLEKLGLDLGVFFSVQDDFIDCYGDPTKSGKIGTDIEDGKPSWLFVTALTNANKEQRQVLLENYGHSDPWKVAKIKNVYEQVEIPRIFAEYEKDALNGLLFSIQNLPDIVPKGPIQELVSVMFERRR